MSEDRITALEAKLVGVDTCQARRERQFDLRSHIPTQFFQMCQMPARRLAA